MWVLDVLFALLIASCVAWVIVGIYSSHKETKGEKIMTCREKLKLEHPELVSNVYGGGCKSCPDTYGYIEGAIADGPKCLRNVVGNHHADFCYECWDRPVEGEDPPRTINLEMPTNDKFQMTEEFLQSLCNYFNQKPVDRKEKYNDAALEIKAMYDAFMAAGFDGNKAYGLVRTFISKTLGKEEK